MINSKLFENGILQQFENKMLNKLKTCKDFSNKRIAASPRSVGDIVQEIVGEEMCSCFENVIIKNFRNDFARRSMEDVSFFDEDDNYFAIDIKTHNRSTVFNMPNITSVERLANFYNDNKNFFMVLLIEYSIQEDKVQFEKIKLIPIENLDWRCLTIGALGCGQIQIANSNNVLIDDTLTRKEWMLTLCDELDKFYPKEIDKINKRRNKVDKVRKNWESR